jgi:hypothetical protein
MIVKCIGNKGSNLSKKTSSALHDEGAEFQMDIGDSFIVYGINIWVGVVNYLVFDKYRENPFWTPAELFEVVDNRLPPNWYFKYYGEDNRDMDLVSAVWGYKEIALNPDHYFGLIERSLKDIQTFHFRQREIDEFHTKIIDQEELEKKLMEMLLNSSHPIAKILKTQYQHSIVTSRKYSGAGFYTQYKVESGISETPNKSFDIGGVSADIGEVKDALAFRLFIRDGFINWLEGYTFLADFWPESYKDVVLKYDDSELPDYFKIPDR